MKRILFLSPNLGSGGAERQIVNVAILLKDRGYNVEFLCYHKENFYEYLLKEKGIQIHWKYLPNYFKRIIEVRRFIRRGNYDVVISFLAVAGFLCNIASIGKKKFKVITGERSAKEYIFSTRKGKIFGWFQRFSDAIVCNSENARQMWVKYYPQYMDKLKVIYNIPRLQPITTSYIPKRDKKLHIVVAASYQYLKNTIGVIEALNLMTEQEKSRIYIDWFGRKEILKDSLEPFKEASCLIEQYNLSNYISLNDECLDIHNKMYEADVVALFSSVEGLPNTICEGMILKKTIIMTKVSDYKVLVDDSNGFLCDWNEYDSIKNALIKASNLTEEELINKGEASFKKAMNLFSQDKIYDLWNAIITDNN